MTTQQAFVLGDETLYREWAYVAMSRGKESNSLYVVAGSDPEREELGGQVAKIDDPINELMRAVGRSRAKDLALDVYEQDEIKNLTFAELRQRWERLGQQLADVPPDMTGQLQRITSERERVEASMRREQDAARRARHQLEPLGLLDRWRHRAKVEELEARLADAVKVNGRLTGERDHLVRRQDELMAKQQEHENWLVKNAPLVQRRFALERELWWRDHQRALAAEVAGPAYLSRAAGEKPGKPSERAAWRAAMHAIESYRERWGVMDQETAVGGAQARGAEKKERDELSKLEKATDAGESREIEVSGLERSLEL